MMSWLNKADFEVTPKSLIGKTVGYNLSRWKGLSLFLYDGSPTSKKNLDGHLIGILKLTVSVKKNVLVIIGILLQNYVEKKLVNGI